MAFDKTYFDQLRSEVDEYLKRFPVGVITVTIKLAFGDGEFNVAKLLKCEEDLLTFCYFDTKKRQELPARDQQEGGKWAYPALVVRYSDIRYVEFNPGIATGSSEMGFGRF